eukprot:TRINITY_DN874_c0_g1_i1.p2 TRINITY_DN874_c0_g1~~TRINITY_DN874_c0_g1_i1.p2  ORF type:complete len:137 (+),score=20.28 TRINITY_DN874_c0_g1_i1:431-841(+)
MDPSLFPKVLPAAVQGAILWAAGVGIVRAVPERILVAPGLGKAALYAATVVGTYITVRAWAALAGWRTRAHLITGVGVGLATALTLDGLVFGFLPEIYAANTLEALGGAGAVFFAGACFLWTSLIHDPSDKTSKAA